MMGKTITRNRPIFLAAAFPARYNPNHHSNAVDGSSMAMPRRFGRQFVLGLAILGLMGCSRNADRPYAAAEERLLKIGNAYLNAANNLGHAPTDFADIKPYLDGDVTEEYLRSPGDGEPFVIMWGIDYHTLPPGSGDPFTVGAYEKKGVKGKRYVLRFPRSVVLMTDAELGKANFPAGHAPPK
jgi:hypothetical protein